MPKKVVGKKCSGADGCGRKTCMHSSEHMDYKTCGDKCEMDPKAKCCEVEGKTKPKSLLGEAVVEDSDEDDKE